MGQVVLESPFINSIFKCTLCHGLIRSPTVINECLDRFCKLCITNHFGTNNQCPTCHITLSNPLDTLKPDLTFQRLLYKIFPSIFQREIACRPSLLSPIITNESTRIHIDSTIDIHLEYWDIALDLLPNSNQSSAALRLSSCYLKCQASTPLLSLGKFIRNKYFLSSDLHIDLFYQTFLLNAEQERLIDICYCFDRMNKNEILDIRFLISPYGYKAICNRIRQLKKPLPSPTIDIPPANPVEKENVTLSPASSSSSSSNSLDPKLKVKIRRSQTASNNWYIPQSQPTTAEPVELPDLVNSCETTPKTPKRKQPLTTTESSSPKKKSIFSVGHVSQPTRTTPLKSPSKPRRRTRFIPTMVQAPFSIFDRISLNHYDYSDQDSDETPLCPPSELLEQTVTTLRPSEMVIVNVEGNVNDSLDGKRTQKTICKVPPYIPETVSPPESSSLSIGKASLSPIRRTLLPKKIPTIIPSVPHRSTSPDLSSSTPLDLSLK